MKDSRLSVRGGFSKPPIGHLVLEVAHFEQVLFICFLYSVPHFEWAKVSCLPQKSGAEEKLLPLNGRYAPAHMGVLKKKKGKKDHYLKVIFQRL